MKFLLSFSLVTFLFLFSGCHQYTSRDNYTTFSTPFGYITKGDSMRRVAAILGEPKDVSHYQRREIWRYDLVKTGEVLVYFENGNVINVGFPDQPKSTCSSCNR